MDIKEALDCLNKLQKSMDERNWGYVVPDTLSSFIYSDLPEVIDAVNEAVEKIEELEAERLDLQIQLERLEG